MTSAAATAPAAEAAGHDGPAKGGKKKLLILAVPVVLVLVGAGLWFTGILPSLLGMGKADEHAAAGAEEMPAHGADSKPAHGAEAKAKAGEPKGGEHKPAAKSGEAKAEGGHKPAEKAAELVPGAPIFIELPDVIANLNTGGRRVVYIKLRSRIELVKASDEPLLKQVMPRLMDLFQTYLREMRPEEMRGSAGTYRLREELIARANIAVAPARIQDLLFTEILIQ